MPDAIPPPATPHRDVTPPQPPEPARHPTDISTAFLTSLNKAMELEKAGTPQPPPKPDATMATPSDEGKYAGTLGQVVQSLIKEAKAKEEAAKNPTPPVVASTSTAATVSTTAPVVKPPEPPAPPAPTPPEPPVQKIPEVERFRLPPIPQVEPTPPSSRLAPSTLDLSGLDDDERAEMDTAIFAEQRHPDRYKGHAQRVLEYIKQHKRMVGELEASGEEDISESARYKAFVKNNKPGITNAERRKLEQERVSYEAAQEAKAEVNRELEDLRKQIAETKAAPVIERTITEFGRVIDTVLPKEDDPLLSQISGGVRTGVLTAAEEFIRLSNKQKAYDHNNPVHRWMADFIEEQGVMFQKTGDSGLKRGNQTFIGRATYNTMPADQRAKHFTFTDDDVLRIMAVNAKMAAERAIAQQRKQLEDAGYTRTPKTGAAVISTTPPQVVPEPSPRTSTGVAPPEPTVSRQPEHPFHKFLMTGATS